MTLKDLAVSFHFPKFSTSRDFYKAFGCRVCMLLSYQMISVYQLYIVEDYVHQTKTEAAGTIATMSMFASLALLPIQDVPSLVVWSMTSALAPGAAKSISWRSLCS